MNTELPKKLKADSIIEAVLEVRFEYPTANSVPEVLYGRIADKKEWRSFTQARLPTADIPAPIRRADPNLRYAPSISLVSPDGKTTVRVGPQVLSYSRKGEYPGWEVLGEEILHAVTHLFDTIPEVKLHRIGLRYINALRSDIHHVSSINDMAVQIRVDNASLSDNLNLNFKSNVGSDFETMTRIASTDFAQGNVPENATFIVDVDVYTPAQFTANDVSAAQEWIEQAHNQEKTSFFRVLGKEITERLRDE